MKNITVSVPNQAHRQARVWAARRDTSISAVVKYMLERLPGLPRTPQPPSVIKSNPATPANTPELSEFVRL
jgi:hypothetical protein